MSTSALAMASTAPWVAAASSGSIIILAMRLCALGISDSPVTSVPSNMRARSWILARVEGITRPRTFKIWLVALRPASIPPSASAMAAIKRLPKQCPAKGESPLKRYCITRSIKGSRSARAVRQLRKSPGGMMPSSLRKRPEEPPSSAEVTTAVQLLVMYFMPRSSVERPVPPPTTVIAGPLVSLRCIKIVSISEPLLSGMTTETTELMRRRVP